MTMSKYYETLITVSILSEGAPFYLSGLESLQDIAYAVTYGDCSGQIIKEEVKELSVPELKERCKEHGTDVEFFIGEEEYD